MTQKNLKMYVPSEKARNIFERTGGHKLETIDYKKLVSICEKKPGYLVEVNIQDYLVTAEPEDLFIVGYVDKSACFGLVEKKEKTKDSKPKTKESKLTLQLFNENVSHEKRTHAAQGLIEGAAALREFTEIMNIDCLAIHLPESPSKPDGLASSTSVGKAKRVANGVFDQALRSAGLNNTAFEDGNKVYTRYNNN